jgi:hypothetical protein
LAPEHGNLLSPMSIRDALTQFRRIALFIFGHVTPVHVVCCRKFVVTYNIVINSLSAASSPLIQNMALSFDIIQVRMQYSDPDRSRLKYKAVRSIHSFTKFVPRGTRCGCR